MTRTFTLQLHTRLEMPEVGDIELRSVIVMVDDSNFGRHQQVRWQWYDSVTGNAIRGQYKTEAAALHARPEAIVMVSEWHARERRELMRLMQPAAERSEAR